MATKQLPITMENLEAARTLVQQLQETLNGLLELTARERQRLTKSSSRSMGFIRYAADVARNEPEHCPQTFDRETYLQEADLWEPLMILQSSVHQLASKLDASTQVLGGNLMHRSQELYQLLKVSQRSHPELAEHVNRLGWLYRRQTGPAPDSPISGNPPSEGAAPPSGAN